jgi:cysteine-rich repeat protein
MHPRLFLTAFAGIGLALAACGGDDSNMLADAPHHDAPHIDAPDIDAPAIDSPGSDAGGSDGSGSGSDGGTTAAVCGNNVMETGETCDDGNTTSGDGCSALCAREVNEVEPNDDGTPDVGGGGEELLAAGKHSAHHQLRAHHHFIDIESAIEGNDFDATAMANADANDPFAIGDGKVDIYAALTPAGDEDVFAITNNTAAPMSVQLDTWNSGTGFGVGVSCGDMSIDTGINIHDSTGTIIAQNDDRVSGSDYCASIRWAIAPGDKIYAHVVEYDDDDEIPGYILQVQYAPVVCGDGITDSTEQCDDGNTTAGDGCSATCTIESTAETEPNDDTATATPVTVPSIYSGTLSSDTDVDTYKVVVAADAVVSAQVFTAFGQCTADELDLALLDSTGTLVSDDDADGIEPCGGLTVPLPAGTYYFQVSGAMSDTYYIAFTSPSYAGMEAEAATADGANDDAADAELTFGANPPNAWVSGELGTDADVDYFAVTVPAGATLRAETIEGSDAIGSCDMDDVDTILDVYDSAGNQLDDDDDGGRGYCSLTSDKNTGAATTWYVAVSGYDALTTYKLVVSVH